MDQGTRGKRRYIDDDARYFEGYPYRGLYGRARRSARRAVQGAMERVGRRRALYLASGPVHPSSRVDPSAFTRGLWLQSIDFVRYATLELLARQIRRGDIPGATAELGVHQGHFSAVMNRHLPDRQLYLLDTFSGFDDRDRAHETARGIRDAPVEPMFPDTNEQFVLSQMPSPKTVVVVNGWFPESAHRIPDELEFCLVSIDVDLYDPTLAGLKWFWPRVARGGFIVVHDYNNGRFPGACVAVDEFLASESAPAVPIPDAGGTIVLPKPL